MSVGEKKFYYKGFQPIYWTFFTGVWSFGVLFMLSGLLVDFWDGSGFYSSQSGLPIYGYLVTIFVPLAFLFITITYMLPKFLKGGYFLLTQKPILIISTTGIEFIYHFKGNLLWEEIVAMRIVKTFSNMDQLVIKTVNPTPLALQSLKSNWFFLNGFLQVFNKRPKDENTIRYVIQEVGIKNDEFEKVVSVYSGTKQQFTFEII